MLMRGYWGRLNSSVGFDAYLKRSSMAPGVKKIISVPNDR